MLSFAAISKNWFNPSSLSKDNSVITLNLVFWFIGSNENSPWSNLDSRRYVLLYPVSDGKIDFINGTCLSS